MIKGKNTKRNTPKRVAKIEQKVGEIQNPQVPRFPHFYSGTFLFVIFQSKLLQKCNAKNGNRGGKKIFSKKSKIVIALSKRMCKNIVKKGEKY